MRRRDFIKIVAGSAAAWPLAARAQVDRKRRIGVILAYAEDNLEAPPRVAAFVKGLEQLGWIDGRNIQIDYRYSGGDPERTQKYATELVALAPDVILAGNTSTVAPLQRATRTLPIVFAGVVDPVAAGFVDTLARPGGNTTGFTQFEYGMSGKWLELLKEIVPHITRAGVLRARDVTITETGEFAAIQAVAPSLGIEISPIGIGDADDEVERAIAAFARSPNNGLIVGTGTPAVRHRKLITKLAVRHRLPAVYPYRFFVIEGGLVSYGPDRVDPFRRAAGYVDRILKGEKPADLPVQAPTRYELVVNQKTSKALGLKIPTTVLTRADEIIE
jgi:putative tryptophan/tyrosine transport system substrate-binding protein